MNYLLLECLSDIEQGDDGLPTREVIMSARNMIADSDFRRDLDEIERRIDEKREEKDE